MAPQAPKQQPGCTPFESMFACFSGPKPKEHKAVLSTPKEPMFQSVETVPPPLEFADNNGTLSEKQLEGALGISATEPLGVSADGEQGIIGHGEHFTVKETQEGQNEEEFASGKAENADQASEFTEEALEAAITEGKARGVLKEQLDEGTNTEGLSLISPSAAMSVKSAHSSFTSASKHTPADGATPGSLHGSHASPWSKKHAAPEEAQSEEVQMAGKMDLFTLPKLSLPLTVLAVVFWPVTLVALLVKYIAHNLGLNSSGSKATAAPASDDFHELGRPEYSGPSDPSQWANELDPRLMGAVADKMQSIVSDLLQAISPADDPPSSPHSYVSAADGALNRESVRSLARESMKSAVCRRSSRSQAGSVQPLARESIKSYAGPAQPLARDSVRSQAGAAQPLARESVRSQAGAVQPLARESIRSQAATAPLARDSVRSQAKAPLPLARESVRSQAGAPQPLARDSSRSKTVGGAPLARDSVRSQYSISRESMRSPVTAAQEDRAQVVALARESLVSLAKASMKLQSRTASMRAAAPVVADAHHDGPHTPATPDKVEVVGHAAAPGSSGPEAFASRLDQVVASGAQKEVVSPTTVEVPAHHFITVAASMQRGTVA